MKIEVRDVLSINDESFKIPMGVYESFAEADKDANSEGAGLREMNNNLLYRGTYQEARSLIVEVVQRVTKVAPLTEDTGEKDEAGKAILEVSEKDGAYVARALATAKMTVAQLQAEVDKACKAANDGAGLRADIRARAKKPAGPKKLAEKFKTIATSFLSGVKDIAKLNAVLSKTLGKSFTKTGNVDADAIALGWLCKEYADAQDAFAKI